MSQKSLACFPVYDLNKLLKLSPFPTPPVKRTDTTKLLWDNRPKAQASTCTQWGQVGLCHQSPDNFSYLVAPPPYCADNSSVNLSRPKGWKHLEHRRCLVSVPTLPRPGPQLLPTKNWHVMETWLKNTWWLKSIKTWWALAETKVESIWFKTKWLFFPFDVSQKGGSLTWL